MKTFTMLFEIIQIYKRTIHHKIKLNEKVIP
jgi:hypothetical protein